MGPRGTRTRFVTRHQTYTMRMLGSTTLALDNPLKLVCIDSTVALLFFLCDPGG